MFRAIEVVLDLIGRFMRWRDKQAAMNQGRDAERVDAAKAVQKEAADAETIRKEVDARLDAHPDQLRDDPAGLFRD